MGDFLTRLVQRTLGMAPVVRPVIAPLYAPGPAMAEDYRGISEEPFPEEKLDTLFPPEDTSVTPVGTPHRTMFSPAVSEKLWRQPERRAEKFPTPKPREENEIPGEMNETETTLQAPEEPLSLPLPLHPEAPVQAPLLVPAEEEPSSLMETLGEAPDQERAETLFATTEDALPSSPDEFPMQRILRPRVVLSKERSPRAVDVPMEEDRGRRAPESAAAAPTIRVTIGRVDVRANLPPAPAPRSKPVRPGPMLSLDAYLKRRDEGH